LDVNAYTYLRLKTANGDVWAAVGKAPIKVGSEVTVHDAAEMRDFRSTALNRTFPTIYFGTVGVASAATPSGTPPAGHPPVGGGDLGQVHGGAAKSIDVGPVKVAKADGANARTVGEINVNRLALKDKTVTVRAKIVKVTPGVMGKTWVHLRDGSGSAADGSDDVVATSGEEPKVGDVVTAKGVVRTDVNIGSGYAYKVLVENVTFQK
jgi:hypothetical protein